MDFYYSQKYYVYANSIIGYVRDWLGRLKALTMASDGCLITCLSMAYSYTVNRSYTPDMTLTWLLRHNGLTPGGLLKLGIIGEMTGGKFKYSTTNTPKAGETVYSIREVNWVPGNSRQKHYVLDDPNKVGLIIDSLDGKPKGFSDYGKLHPYTGRVIYYIGKK